MSSYESLVRVVHDFPIPGIPFRDITPLLGDAGALREAVADLAAPYRGARVDKVAAVEARGLILGAPLAVELGAGFVPLRKEGKLPHDTVSASYELEYGAASIEMHADALRPGERVLVVDDVLATGGTLAASLGLVEGAGAVVAGVAVLIELDALGGRSRLPGRDVTALLHF